MKVTKIFNNKHISESGVTPDFGLITLVVSANISPWNHTSLFIHGDLFFLPSYHHNQNDNIPMPHPFINASLQAGFPFNKSLVFQIIMITFLYWIPYLCNQYDLVWTYWIFESFWWSLEFTWFFGLFQGIGKIFSKFSEWTGWFKAFHHKILKAASNCLEKKPHILGGGEYDDKPQHKCIDPKKEGVHLMDRNSGGNHAGDLNQFFFEILKKYPDFNSAWFISDISYVNCTTRSQYLWIKAANELVKLLDVKYKDLFAEYAADLSALLANPEDSALKIKCESSKSKLQDILLELNILNCVRKNRIVPDHIDEIGRDLNTSADDDLVDDVSTMMEIHGFEFISESSYIIKCDYSDNHSLDMEEIPNKEEIDKFLPSTSQSNSQSYLEIKREEIKDHKRELARNKMEIRQARPESSDVVRSGPRPRRVADLSSNIERSSRISRSSILAKPPVKSGLSIEWKLNDKGKRSYSTKAGGEMSPVKIYKNADLDKSSIIKENTDLAGVYLWTNLVTGRRYVASATVLSDRLNVYYSPSKIISILSRSRSHILSAILKHGMDKFSLSILEYCEPENCISREDFWIETLRPEYNILLKAGSSLGFRHSPETKKNLRISKK